jgi:hypothetical protein
VCYTSLEWLQKHVEHIQSKKNDMFKAIEEFEDLDKLGQGLILVDPLEVIDIGYDSIFRPAHIKN